LPFGLVVEEDVGQAPGFFGKLPSRGDFVGRRLPPDVRDCFDRWLQAGLVRSKEDLGEDWLPTWLSSPIWRFVVAAGVCGEQAWAGVMMPSHDRVGRCFPLLLMAGMDGTPSLQDCLGVHETWFVRLEDLALSTLDEEFSLDAFDASVAELAGAPCGSQANSVDAGPLDEIPAGGSAWWSDGSELVEPVLAVCSGLPSHDMFAALLDGAWLERRWACRPRSSG
jgi:type VI secretion system protein ImpM